VSGVVRRDRRALGVLLTAAAVLLGGWWFARLEPTHAPAPVAQGDGELRRHFDAAVLLLHSRRYADAQVLLRRVIELAPRLPEAHVNMGFAWLGLQRAAQARESFEHALTLKADQANAYYGLALAQESLGDLELALGAMRSYLHLARDGSEAHLRRARSALWEWEAQIEQRRASARR
jgi:tetratricopeptide (TPR) repeat protein